MSKQEEVKEFNRVADIDLLFAQWILSEIKDNGGASSYNPEVVDKVIAKLNEAKESMIKAREVTK